ncbi:MAG TPA: hypothetical protein DCR97_11525 [Deltaproteobacteria bacterium]|nr:hypothetical protein [Deltaproteobacteria bacterium]
MNKQTERNQPRPGQAPFGKTSDEREILLRIAFMRKGKAKKSYEQIAQQLNAENLLTRLGRQWTGQNVYSVFRRNQSRKSGR